MMIAWWCGRSASGSQYRETGSTPERAVTGAFFVCGARPVVGMAERVGFEPTNGGYPLPAFQASLISHSSTSPRGGLLRGGLPAPRL